MKSFTLVAHDYGTDFTATFRLSWGGSVSFSKNHLLNVLTQRNGNMINAASRLESVQAAYDYLSGNFQITEVVK